MFAIDQLILIGALLLLVSVVSNKFSTRLGVPVLVGFLALGMFAGEEGPGGIVFDDVGLAHAIGTLALAVILFDGGLRTPLSAVRTVWKPASVLATVGVIVTAGVTGIAATWLLGIPVEQGLLLGAIIGSTDAAAVFLILRSQGLNVRPRLSALLELESGSNDPMAVFLTVMLIELVQGQLAPGWGMLGSFLWQMGAGALIGIVGGRVAAELINRIRLGSAGLYPVLTVSAGLVIYGLGAAASASGFLAVYFAGIVLGNQRFVYQRATLLVHDALAWMSQIVMFVVLGLLSFPSRAMGVAWEGILITVVLLLVARPLAILLAIPFKFEFRELSFLALAGPKGAVPIILATFPLLAKVPHAEVLFNIVFFVVVISALTQGWTMGPWARFLKVQEPEQPEPPVALEITTLEHIEAEIVDYPVITGSFADRRRVRDLALPEGATVALITRGTEVIPPRGSSRLEAGDHVYVVVRPGVRYLVRRVLTPEASLEGLPAGTRVPLEVRASLGEIAEVYGVVLVGAAQTTIGAVVSERLGGEVQAGAVVEVDGVPLEVGELVDGVPQAIVVTLVAGVPSGVLGKRLDEARSESSMG